jgi:hypothetical protein
MDIDTEILISVVECAYQSYRISLKTLTKIEMDPKMLGKKYVFIILLIGCTR